ncbi:hypothetical protein ABGB14_35745 [Nonomuraea sp. B10E15]|uniref:hypothetical protein n=1 Tax=Nonomuraea sp. B10E15 TaxID=3153560 RepID=UPI00325ECF7F
MGERYRRITRRRGKSKILVAAGNSLLTIIYHLLSGPQARFHDVGADYHDSRINKDRRARSLASQLQASPAEDRHPQRQDRPDRARRGLAHNASWIPDSDHRSGFAAACPAKV